MAEEDIAEELWGNGFTAQALSGQLPGRSVAQWTLWLRNNRNQSRRVPYRINFVRISNGTFYSPKEIEKFVEWEKSRRLGTIKPTDRSAEVMRAFGVGTSSGSIAGRKLEIVDISHRIDRATGETYVQLITGDPLMIYRLDARQARQVAARLVEAAGGVDPDKAAPSQAGNR